MSGFTMTAAYIQNNNNTLIIDQNADDQDIFCGQQRKWKRY